jgi:uncharacterized membrane protein YphA (DoxX/SURF4 family)
MEKLMNWNCFFYGLGAISFGVVGIAFGDFALQWQPVPKDLPIRTGLAYASAAVLVLTGCLALFRRTASQAALALGIIYALWTVVLKTPKIFSRPLEILSWLGFSEIAAMAAAGFALFAIGLQANIRDTTVLAARIVAGCCAIVFGFSHFAYPTFTAGMVPAWIPVPLFWAYATGAGHVAAGLGLISGIQARLAATVLALMVGSFALLVHLPRVFAKLDSHTEWTMLAVAMSLAGATWGLSRSIATAR